MDIFLLIASLFAFVSNVSCTTINSICTDGRSCQIWKLSLERNSDEHSECMTTISVEADTSISSENMNLDVIHKVEEVNGRRTFSIKGVSKDTTRTIGKLYFNRKHGKNIAITGDGRTVQKLNLDEPHYSNAFTHRPLRNDEVFEVRLDKKNTKYSYSLGIGILLKPPDEIDIPPQFWKTPLAWIMHNDKIYQNSTAVIQNYGKNLNELQVGDRVGVMRSRFGALHFFVNGVDQGPVLAHVPETVYGLLELWYNAAKATIVDRESSL